MQKQIISETITMNKPENLDTQTIEKALKDKFGELLRWAIIEISADTLKICVTYEE